MVTIIPDKLRHDDITCHIEKPFGMKKKGNMDIEERLINVFKDIFDLSRIQDKMNLSRESIDDWDSIGHIRLIYAIEEEFQIRIPLEYVVRFESLKTISECLSKEFNISDSENA